ncbi:MAG: cytochrome c-type biogenesis protein CcmH [Terriglobales bacterium]
MFKRFGKIATRRMHTRLLFVAIIALLSLGASDTNTRFDGLGHKLMCTCGCNQVLLECNHVGCPASDRMRGELIAAINRGDNDDLILQGFVQKYGTVVLAAPTTQGFNRVAWIMPYVALLLGIGGVYLLVRTWHLRRAPTPTADTSGVEAAQLEAYRRRVHEETEL